MEYFIVVADHGLIQKRNINTIEVIELEISGDEIETVTMIPGWTRNIINLSNKENLATVMTCKKTQFIETGCIHLIGEEIVF